MTSKYFYYFTLILCRRQEVGRVVVVLVYEFGVDFVASTDHQLNVLIVVLWHMILYEL